jgi:hypothetical protein
MNFSTDYEQALPAIEAITHKQVQKPTISVGILIQEAHNLYHWAYQDQEVLISRGLSTESLNKLLEAAKACTEAQANWFILRLSEQEATKKWKKLHKEALKLHSELLNEYSFALQDNKHLMSVIKRIKKGEGLADLIQDLYSLYTLGKDNLEKLNKTGFDTNMLSKAENFVDNYSHIHFQSKKDKDNKDNTLLLRNKAYTYLKQLVDEIRNIGKFTFSNNKERVKGYQLQYKSRNYTPLD